MNIKHILIKINRRNILQKYARYQFVIFHIKNQAICTLNFNNTENSEYNAKKNFITTKLMKTISSCNTSKKLRYFQFLF